VTARSSAWTSASVIDDGGRSSGMAGGPVS
jgi:hypothetical protein